MWMRLWLESMYGQRRLQQVGGVKEKVTAAHRAGIKTIVLPFANKRDLEEIPEHIKKDLTFHFAKELMDVIDVAIPDLKK